MEEKIKLLIADDHAILRQGLRRILEAEPDMSVIGEAATGIDAVKRTKQLKPDVVIMDIRMEGMDGIEATHAIRRVSPTARVVILTQYNDTALRTAARDAGAMGYVLKDDLSVLQTVVSSLP